MDACRVRTGDRDARCDGPDLEGEFILFCFNYQHRSLFLTLGRRECCLRVRNPRGPSEGRSIEGEKRPVGTRRERPGGFKTRPRGAEVRSFSANSIALSPFDLRVYLFVFCYILFIIFTMAEKAEMPADTVSLPPTYAPSEAYTESPPPVSTHYSLCFQKA